MKSMRFGMAIVAAAAAMGWAGSASAGLIMSVYHGVTFPARNEANVAAAQAYAASHTASSSFTIDNPQFVWSGGDNVATNTFFGSDGAHSTDTASMNDSLFIAEGYISIATAGDYTFSIPSSDDAVEVLIDHAGVAANGWAKSFALPISDTKTLSAGLHAFELVYWQGYGGANMTLNISGPGAVSFTTTAPEPATMALLATGGLFMLSSRGRRTGESA